MFFSGIVQICGKIRSNFFSIKKKKNYTENSMADSKTAGTKSGSSSQKPAAEKGTNQNCSIQFPSFNCNHKTALIDY